eukprot:EG_transcript_7230
MIGMGGQASVYQVTHAPTSQIYALKVIRAERYMTKDVVWRELSHILNGVKHPNIVASHQAFYRDSQLHILMDFMDGGDLRTILQHFGPSPSFVVQCIAQQVLQGLERLHMGGVVHRDIKPSNLLLDLSGHVKISDFGIAKVVPRCSGTLSDSAAWGSHSYMSPEQLCGDECGPPTDVWSFGLTMAQAALGVYPFLSDDIVLDRDGSQRDSVGTLQRLSVDSSRVSLSPTPHLQPTHPSKDYDWSLPSPTQAAPACLLASPCPSGSSGPSPGHAVRRDSLGWASGPRESLGTAISSPTHSAHDGNPFTRDMSRIELSLMFQDPTVRVHYERVVPLLREWYPHWPVPEVTDDLRHFTDCCVRHRPRERWPADRLLQHRFVRQAPGAEALAQWLRTLPPQDGR